jgi:peptidoglycan/xylan/chitin deacetylase (PgdA/CDA1 family)
MRRVVREMRDAGYQYFDWNVSSTDAAAPVQDRDMIIASVLGASKGKRDVIVLMHDNTYKTTTVEALPTIIEGLRKQGFTFDVLRKSSFTFQFLKPD